MNASFSRPAEACRISALAAAAFFTWPCATHAAGIVSTSAEHTFYFGVVTDVAGRTRLDSLHVDMRVSYFGGEGTPTLATANISEPDNPASELYYTPDAAYCYLNANTQTTMGQAALDQGYGFIGATAGQSFWHISSSVGAGDSIFLGLSTADDDNNELVAWNPGDADRGANTTDKFIRLDLVRIEGPAGGEFALFDFGSGGAAPSVYMATSDGIDEDDCFYLTAGSHDHVNWTFTQPGVYALTFRMTTLVVEKYDNWRWTAGLDSAGTDGFAEHATAAALPNGVRYALGLDAAAGAPLEGMLPVATSEGNLPGFLVGLPSSARPDITYAIWRATDLAAGDWAQVATKTGTATWSTSVQAVGTDGSRTLYLWSEEDAPASGEAFFYQLRVTQN
ncbi:MAG: choice-of-anchor M domain-containing protein [Verrucomicrobiota bacterium JB024]|nr:choice-of-anchor M domain-containing protein [Verrucomicrobiota bacterium JB024]